MMDDQRERVKDLINKAEQAIFAENRWNQGGCAAWTPKVFVQGRLHQQCRRFKCNLPEPRPNCGDCAILVCGHVYVECGRSLPSAQSQTVQGRTVPEAGLWGTDPHRQPNASHCVAAPEHEESARL